MRHRMGVAECTKLGNPEPCLLDNQWSKNEELNDTLKVMFKEALELYFKDKEGFDFKIEQENGTLIVSMGYEPAYKFERLKILTISTDKEKCYIQTGRAYDFYGSGIRATTKWYPEYKNNSKFIKFIDKWQPELVKVC